MLVPALAWADKLALETVVPTAPGKNNVRWWEFDWKWTDFEPVKGGSPVRLYFYQQEKEIAQVAKPFIEKAYADFTGSFHYLPRHQIPFLLYNSHFEFESTRAFLVSEGILGVTSPQDLRMALPYWGEHRRFQHVMRHELAHQFTIQKVVDLGRAQKFPCNPLNAFPLWFVEGIAETFSQDGLSADARAAIADRLVGRKEDAKVRLPDFFAPAEGTFERVYLLGHAQVRFIEQRYGSGTVVRVLEASPKLCPRRGFGLGASREEVSFAALVAGVVQKKPQEVDQDWKLWAREQVAQALVASHPLSTLELVEHTGSGEVDALSLSPDGRVLLYRTVDASSGLARLYLRAVGEPGSTVLVAQDQRPGLQSLHPFDRTVVAVGAELVAYIGRVNDSDVVFAQRYRLQRQGGRARLELERPLQHDLSRQHQLLEGGYPAIHPRTGAVVFVGLSRRNGFLDLYQLERPLEPDSPIRKLTDDPYAEQGLAYSRAGALYFISDATPDGQPELFRWDERGPAALTDFPGEVELSSPAPDPQGGVVFTADANGYSQVYRYLEGQLTRLTDVPTLFKSPALSPGDQLFGIVLVDQHRLLAALPKERFLSEPLDAAPEQPVPLSDGAGGAGVLPWKVPTATLSPIRDYSPFSLSNYQLVAANAALTLGPLALGEVVFADRLRAHLIGLSAEVLGGLDRTNAALFYFDQSGRVDYGGGLFIRTGLQLAGDARDELNTFFVQRIGALAEVSYPFNPFLRLEGFLSPQSIRAYDFSLPGDPFALESAGSFAGVEAGVGLALDTLRFAPIGPVNGLAASLGVQGTAAFGRAQSFAQLTADLHQYATFIRGVDRLFFHGRLAAGSTLGGPFREDFYLPAGYNLRAFPDGDLRQIGEHYYLGTAELQFPLAPDLGGIYLQGLVGFDAGGIAVNLSRALEERVAAYLIGGNLVIGPLALRVHFARGVDLGAGLAEPGWTPHVTITLPFLML